MDPQQIEGYLRLGSILVELGFDTAEKFKAALKRLFHEKTDAELNAIVDVVVARATDRKARALAEAEKAESLAALLAPPPVDPAE